MAFNRHWLLSGDNENRSQEFNTSRQSLSALPVRIVFEDRSPHLNPQIPSLDDSEFELLSFEEFEESFNFVRLQKLVELMKFDIDDAASHAARLSIDEAEPMHVSELNVRMKDLRRLHREIISTFQELMKLTKDPDVRQSVSELFRNHASIFMLASSSYDSKIEKARMKKSNFRIDFRENFPANFAPKFSRTLRSGDIVYNPTSLESSAPLSPASQLKPLTPPPLRIVNRALLSESAESSTKPQLEFLTANVHSAEVPLLLSRFRQKSNSRSEQLVQRLTVAPPKHDRKTTLLRCDVEKVSCYGSSESPSKQLHSTKLTSSSELPTSLVFPSGIQEKVRLCSFPPMSPAGYSKMSANPLPVLIFPKASPHINQGSVDASSTAARSQTQFTNRHAISIPSVSRIQANSNVFVQRQENAILSWFRLLPPLLSHQISSLRTSTSTSRDSANTISLFTRFRLPSTASGLSVSLPTSLERPVSIQVSLPASVKRPAPGQPVPCQVPLPTRVERPASSLLVPRQVSLPIRVERPAPSLLVPCQVSLPTRVERPALSLSVPSQQMLRQQVLMSIMSLNSFQVLSSSTPKSIVSPCAILLYTQVYHISSSPLVFSGSSRMPAKLLPISVRFRKPSMDHFTIASPAAARIRMNLSPLVQRPANVSLQATSLHLHTQLPAAFQTSGFDEKIKEFIEVFKETFCHNEAGEILAHSLVNGTFCNLECNCNIDCEFIQDKKLIVITLIKFAEGILVIELLKYFAHAFNVSDHDSSSLIATNFLMFHARNFEERFYESVRANESSFYVDVILILSEALTLVDPASATIKLSEHIKRSLKKKGKLSNVFKLHEDLQKNLIFKMSFPSRSMSRVCINLIDLCYLMGFASGCPEIMYKDDFRVNVKKMHKTIFGTYHFILPPEFSVRTQRLTAKNITRFQQRKELNLSTNNHIEKIKLVRFSVGNGFCSRQHVHKIFIKFLPQQVVFIFDKNNFCASDYPEALLVSRNLTTTCRVPADLEAFTFEKSSMIYILLQRKKEKTSIRIIKTTAAANMCPQSSWSSRTC